MERKNTRTQEFDDCHKYKLFILNLEDARSIAPLSYARLAETVLQEKSSPNLRYLLV
jgi:hypothetical protein